MGLITATGEVRKIETRAMTPFLDNIGIEASCEQADRIIDSAWILGHVPEDAPYADVFRELGIAVAQMCAESGYLQRDDASPLSNRRSASTFSRSLLANRGIDDNREEILGEILGVGQDLWNRMSFDERHDLPPFERSCWINDALLDEQNNETRSYLNGNGVISGGMMRILSAVALNGYLWGRGEDIQLLQKTEIVPTSGNNEKSFIWVIPNTGRGVRPLSIEKTVFKRSLAQAQELRKRDAKIKAAWDEAINQSPEFVSS